mgnify:CR=1 FL=1
MSLVSTPISVGELLDKVTILEIKQEKISDPEKLKNVQHELSLLETICEQEELLSPEILKQKQALRHRRHFSPMPIPTMFNTNSVTRPTPPTLTSF